MGVRYLALSLWIFLLIPAKALSWGEIFSLRAPDEIHEGDDVTIFITASPTEEMIDRVLAVSFPQGWKIVRAWAVSAGTDETYPLAPTLSIGREIRTDAGQQVVALADTVFLSDAPGVAYFVTFSTLPSSNKTAVVKAALVERLSPDAPEEIDKKTKKPKPRNTEWKLSFPERPTMDLTLVTGKRIAPTIKLISGWKFARGLALRGPNSSASLRTFPPAITSFFQRPFSLEFWFRSATPYQRLLQLGRDDGSFLSFGANALGQLYLYNHGRKDRDVIFGTKSMATDGQWHHLILSYDSSAKFTVFLDAQKISQRDVDQRHFEGITAVTLGESGRANDLMIDELRFLKRGFSAVEEFAPFIARSARDTMTAAFALFHLDEFGEQARASRPLYLTSDIGGKSSAYPTFFQLDSNAKLTETTSPVQTDQVLLTAEMVSPTRVSIMWKVSSELGVKEYSLERRVGSFGEFEEVIGADAKKSIQQPKKGQSLVSRAQYSVVEELPRLKGDIDLYYRVAMIMHDDDVHYSEPIKLEYGETKDVFVEQNDPNPFNPTTTLAFRLVKPAHVKLAVYDIIGREIITIVNSKLDAGRHKYVLDAGNWPGGIYFYKVKTAQSTITRKMVLAK